MYIGLSQNELTVTPGGKRGYDVVVSKEGPNIVKGGREAGTRLFYVIDDNNNKYYGNTMEEAFKNAKGYIPRPEPRVGSKAQEFFEWPIKGAATFVTGGGTFIAFLEYITGKSMEEWIRGNPSDKEIKFYWEHGLEEIHKKARNSEEDKESTYAFNKFMSDKSDAVRELRSKLPPIPERASQQAIYQKTYAAPLREIDRLNIQSQLASQEINRKKTEQAAAEELVRHKYYAEARAIQAGKITPIPEVKKVFARPEGRAAR